MNISRVDPDTLLDLRWRVLHPYQARGAAHVHRERAATSRHWAIWEGDALVGGVSVVARRGWALRALAVDPAWQRRGYGALLLRHVQDEVSAPMWCNARVAVIPFYEAQGWFCEGPRFELEGEGTHQRMTWAGPASVT